MATLEPAAATVLVVGATGATGRLLLRGLLDRDQQVTAIVRSADRLPGDLRHHPGLRVVSRPILELSQAELIELLRPCRAVASCLGHSLSARGIFGPPRRLVTEAVRHLCAAIQTLQPPQPVRLVLMNTAGNRNRDLIEPISTGHRIVLGLIRTLLPPQRDNEQAADYLRVEIGPLHRDIEWVVVRPDTLIDEAAVSPYTVYASPTRSAIFDPGRTSRINVAHFIAELITNDEAWAQWRGQMPVIYNQPAC